MAKYSNISGSTTKLNFRAGLSGWDAGTSVSAWYADASMNHVRWLMATRIVT